MKTHPDKFGHLPYGTCFVLDEVKYTKLVYPDGTILDHGSGKALCTDGRMEDIGNMVVVEVKVCLDKA